jgi:hypothetical protein
MRAAIKTALAAGLSALLAGQTLAQQAAQPGQPGQAG